MVYAICNNKVRTGRSKISETTISKRRSRRTWCIFHISCRFRYSAASVRCHETQKSEQHIGQEDMVYANCNNKVRTGRSKISETTISKRRSRRTWCIFHISRRFQYSAASVRCFETQKTEQQIGGGDMVYANCNNKVRTGHSKISKTTISKRRLRRTWWWGLYCNRNELSGLCEWIPGAHFWQLVFLAVVELWYCWSEICLEESLFLQNVCF